MAIRTADTRFKIVDFKSFLSSTSKNVIQITGNHDSMYVIATIAKTNALLLSCHSFLHSRLIQQQMPRFDILFWLIRNNVNSCSDVFPCIALGILLHMSQLYHPHPYKSWIKTNGECWCRQNTLKIIQKERRFNKS